MGAGGESRTRQPAIGFGLFSKIYYLISIARCSD